MHEKCWPMCYFFNLWENLLINCSYCSTNLLLSSVSSYILPFWQNAKCISLTKSVNAWFIYYMWPLRNSLHVTWLKIFVKGFLILQYFLNTTLAWFVCWNFYVKCKDTIKRNGMRKTWCNLIMWSFTWIYSKTKKNLKKRRIQHPI